MFTLKITAYVLSTLIPRRCVNIEERPENKFNKNVEVKMFSVPELLTIAVVHWTDDSLLI